MRSDLLENQFTEIERKFLIDRLPTSLPMLERKEVYQAYLSIDPEVRIRRNVVEGIDVSYYIAIKSNGELIRREVEIPISKEYFYALADMVEHPFVKKDFSIYDIDGLILECSHVDKGTDTEFMYAEVEFQSVEDANNFVPPSICKMDVTNDPSYKMKNYWKRTRN